MLAGEAASHTQRPVWETYGEGGGCLGEDQGFAWGWPLQGLRHEFLRQGSLGQDPYQGCLSVNSSLSQPSDQLAEGLACHTFLLT